MDVQDFRNWQKRMGFDGRGGQKATAEALGLSVAMVRIYENGTHPDGKPVNYPLPLRYALSAIAMNVPPWPVR